MVNVNEWFLFENKLDKEIPYATNLFHIAIGFIASSNKWLLIIITIIFAIYQIWEYELIHDTIFDDFIEYFLGVFIGLYFQK